MKTLFIVAIQSYVDISSPNYVILFIYLAVVALSVFSTVSYRQQEIQLKARVHSYAMEKRRFCKRFGVSCEDIGFNAE